MEKSNIATLGKNPSGVQRQMRISSTTNLTVVETKMTFCLVHNVYLSVHKYGFKDSNYKRASFPNKNVLSFRTGIART